MTEQTAKSIRITCDKCGKYSGVDATPRGLINHGWNGGGWRLDGFVSTRDRVVKGKAICGDCEESLALLVDRESARLEVQDD